MKSIRLTLFLCCLGSIVFAQKKPTVIKLDSMKVNPESKVMIPCIIDFTNVCKDCKVAIHSTSKDSVVIEPKEIAILRLKSIEILTKNTTIDISGTKLKVEESIMVKINSGNPFKQVQNPATNSTTPIEASQTGLEIFLSNSNRSTIEDAIQLNHTYHNKTISKYNFGLLYDFLKDNYNVELEYKNNKISVKNGNKYLEAFFDSTIIKPDTKKTVDIDYKKIVDSQSALPSPTIVADALGTFIAKRFKEEINIAFLDNFKKQLDNDNLKLIFPKTQMIMSQNEPYNYTSYFQAMRESLSEDLNSLPQNGVNFLSKKIIAENDEQKMIKIAAGAFGLDMIANIQAQKTLNEIISNLGSKEYLKGLEKSKVDSTYNLGATIKFISILSQNLETKTKDNWTNTNNLKKLKDINIIKLFLGLVIEKDKKALSKIKYQNGKSLIDILNENYGEVTKISSRFELLSNKITEFNDLNNKIIDSEKNPPNLAKTQYILRVTRAWDIIEVNFSLLEAFNFPVFNNKLIKLQELTGLSFSVTNYVKEKKYGLALASMIQIYQKASSDSTSIVRANMVKYGNFAVSLINAQNSDEALKALETAAMPVGSYRIKRNNHFNISINAYGGIFGGSETFGGDTKFTYGATAPVGIYLGWGKEQNKVKDNNGKGLGFFVSILDVGSVFALRLSDTTSVLPELAWRNILAPGLNIVYNFCKCPVTIMAGVQHGPELRSFNTIKNTTSGQDELKTVIDSNAWRFHISAVIDIPVFNIYTKANKR